MNLEVTSPPFTAKNLVERIIAMRCITRTEQQLLMSTLLHQAELSDEDNSLIQQVFDKLRQGRIRVL